MVVLIAERVTQRGLCAALVLSELKKTSQIPCELEGSVTIDRSYTLPPPAETWHWFWIIWIQSTHASRKQSHLLHFDRILSQVKINKTATPQMLPIAQNT